MDLHESLRVCRKHARMILAVFLASVSVAGYYGYTSPKIYQSEVGLYVAAESGVTIGGEYVQDDGFSRAQLSALQANTYARVISGPRVAFEVAERISYRDAAGNLMRPSISASAIADTNLIEVTVVDGDPLRAQRVANMVGTVVPSVVDALERPTGSERSSLRISVSEPASLLMAPIAPRKKLIMMMGAFFGVLAGVGVAVLRDKLDKSIRNPDELAAATHAPVLGVIAYDPRTPRRPLVVHSDPRSPTAESYRQLRTNIKFVNIDRTVRSLVVTSAVSSEGKSTVACNLAIAMAQAGQRVILVEADLRKPSVRRYMGIEGAVGLSNVLLGEVALEDVLQPWGGGLLEILPGGAIAPNPSELLGSAGMADVIRQLEAMSDLVIFDAPPLLPVTDAAVLGVNTDGAVLVVRSGATGRDRLDRAVESLGGVGVNILGAVLNMAATRGPEAYHYYAYYGKDQPRAGVRGWLQRPGPFSRAKRSIEPGKRRPAVENRSQTAQQRTSSTRAGSSVAPAETTSADR